MLKIKFIKELIYAICISVLIFITLTFISYFIHLNRHVDFKVGLPWTFYYQFLIDNEIQHGSNLSFFFADTLLTLTIVCGVWLFIRRKDTVK
jgi:hypothetical protein